MKTLSWDYFEIHNEFTSKNIEFKEISDRNLELLSKKKIQLLVQKYGFDRFINYTKDFIGEIDEDGIVNCVATEFENSYNFQSKIYPDSYVCSFNGFGQFKLELSETEFSFFGGRNPKRYEGIFIKKGIAIIKSKALDLNFGGSRYAEKLVGRIVFIDKNEKKEFFENRQRLLEIIKKDLKE